jgi:glucose-1-phosphate cytidylyltransferase
LKAVILAGGFGTRISEETQLKPKPLIEIGGMPILWHIMKTYSHYGINDFVICCGYKGYMIKEYFANYFLHTSDITIDMKNNDLEVHQKHTEPWKVTMIDTGLNTMTGGRLKKIQKYVENETFCFTYGDGLSDINITNLLKFHKTNKTFATTTAVQPPGRYGALKLKNNKVDKFTEKPLGDGSLVNGGYFVLEPEVFDYVKGNNTVWEKEPLENLATENQLSAFVHKGFWHALDTLRDKNNLEELWNSKNTPWKVWK